MSSVNAPKAKRSGPGGRATRVKPPSPAKHRRPALIGLAILLIVGGAAVAGLIAVRIDNRVPVIVAARPIAVGATITADDLATSRVASEGLTLIGSSQVSEVVGKFAAQNIPQGRLLDSAMLSTSGFLREGSAAVGVKLESGRVPASGVIAGDTVQVVAVGGEKAGEALVERAVVASVNSPSSSSGGIVGGSSSSGGTTATLIVDADDAAAVATASGGDGIALVLLSRGGEVEAD